MWNFLNHYFVLNDLKKFIKRALCIKINLVYRSIFSTCLFVCCCLFYHELLDFDRINLVLLGVVGCH